MMEDKVILVNETDEEKGYMEKMEAHRKGALHRAFSIFIFNSRGEMLIQQRALNKYHSAGLWSNACCSHPFPGEDINAAALRRLQEELGFSTPLEKVFDFIYRTEFENGLTEYEFDHVFTGEYNGPLHLNLREVHDFCYMSLSDIRKSVLEAPERYTVWFRIAFPKIESWWIKNYQQMSI